jgi:transcriptional regulator with XRE-family HTH domain
MDNDAVFPVGDAEYDAVYAQEAAMVDASELIARALDASGKSLAELARSLGVSRSEITARLKGERNITVRTLAETLHALGARLELTTADETDSTRARARVWRPRRRVHSTESRTRDWVRAEDRHAR